MRKTKIVCTIGPACSTPEIVAEMIKAGMNVARLNFSHGTHESHAEAIAMLKEVRRKLEVPLAIMLDTKGPEIRLGEFEGGEAVIESGSEFILTSEQLVGNSSIASVSYRELPSELHDGDTILIDDGKVRLRAERIEKDRIHCTVIHGGRLTNRKSIGIPGSRLSVPFLSEQDKSDLLFGIEQGVDIVAASFVRRAADVDQLRKFLDYNGGRDILIISKIENIEGIENFDEILALSNGIMVARGDLGVEIDFERLPGLQKRFIRKCYRSGKMVITATQMLESMISSPSPTRAEITDVANAVFDGTSAVMLSGETASGMFPVRAIEVMAKIAVQAESDSFELDEYRYPTHELGTVDSNIAICDAACSAAHDLKAGAIIALSKYGGTARAMSRFRPHEPIVAATPVEKTFHQLSLSWGVYPVLARRQSDSEELLMHAVDCAKQTNLVKNGDTVVIAAGVPLDTPGNTNLLKVEIVGTRR